MSLSRGVCHDCRLAIRIARQRAGNRSFVTATKTRAFSALPTTRLPLGLRPQTWQSLRPSRLSATILPIRGRFNSTQTSPNAELVDSPASFNGAYDLLPDAAAQSPVNNEWYIGYLSEQLGSFGYGPTSTVQWIFEHVHVYTGSTIGISILLTTAAIRLGMFPLLIAASDTSAKMQILKPQLDKYTERMREAGAEKDRKRLMVARHALTKLRRDNNIKMWKLGLPLLQIPLGFGSWRLLRNMADVPVAGMDTGGLLWFQNLAVADPYFVLPLAVGAAQHLSIRLGGDTGNVQAQTMRNILLYVLPVLTPLFIGFAPAAVQLTFFMASVLGVISGAITRNPSFRRWLDITPLPQPAIRPAPLAQSSSVASGTRDGGSDQAGDKSLSRFAQWRQSLSKRLDVIGNSTMTKNAATKAVQRSMQDQEARRITQARNGVDEELEEVREKRQRRRF